MEGFRESFYLGTMVVPCCLEQMEVFLGVCTSAVTFLVACGRKPSAAVVVFVLLMKEVQRWPVQG